MNRSRRPGLPRAARPFVVVAALAVSPAGCDERALFDRTTPVDALRRHLESDHHLQHSGWMLRSVYEADGQLYAVIDFPPRGSGRARLAPEFQQLLRVCPVFGVDDYWQQRSARPFTLYLAKQGRSGAFMMARCLPSFDQAAHQRVANGSMVPPQIRVLPPEDADPAQIEHAASGGSPSFDAVRDAMHPDDPAQLQKHLNARPELVQMYGPGGRTLLFSADSVEEVTVLIAYGADPNVRAGDGPTVLGWHAEFSSRYGVVKRLLAMGATADGVEPGFAGSARIATRLLDHGAALTDDSLYQAISRGAFDVAEVLYQRGARLDDVTFPASPLHTQVSRARRDGVDEFTRSSLPRIEALLRFGADINGLDPAGRTALDIARQQDPWHGRDRLIELLQRHAAVAAAAR